MSKVLAEIAKAIAPLGCGLPPADRAYDPSKRARKSSAMLNPSDNRGTA